MKYLLIISLLLLTTIKSQSLENDKTYLAHGIEHGINHPYGVSELIIKTDSTFSWKSYNVNKNNWKSYSKNKSVISLSGKVIKENELFVLKEIGCNSKGPHEWFVKITEKKIEFYNKKKTEIIKTKTEYKRIKASG